MLNFSQEDSDSNKEEKIENIPSSLLGHKKLFIKHTIPAPPIYPKTQLKAASEVLKSVKVDKLSSGKTKYYYSCSYLPSLFEET